MTAGKRIAMWSGARNLSTALMRSFGSRPDTVVCDEPLYPYYLARTGIDHPGADEVVAAGETDWRKVIASLTGEIPGGKDVFYQKHMAHHLLPEVDRGWLSQVTHAFLIRSPGNVIASLARKLGHPPQLGDTGLPQQVEIFEHARALTGRIPPVVDARDILENPERILTRLCDALEIPFMREMLSWQPGPRATDGIWAKHWYVEVERSTGFAPYRPEPVDLPEELSDLLAECDAVYRRLHPHRIT